jgi:hypothetical protein
MAGALASVGQSEGSQSDWSKEVFEKLIDSAQGIRYEPDKSQALSSIVTWLVSFGQLSWCEKIIPIISRDKDRAEAISVLLIALAKDQPQKAVNRLEEITVFDVRMDCIKKLSDLFECQKDNLKSLVSYAIEDAETVDIVLGDLILCYQDGTQLIETAKVLGVADRGIAIKGDSY